MEELIRCLHSSNVAVGARAEGELVNIGPFAVPKLLKALRSPSARVRCRAAWSLGKIRDARGLRPLLRACADTDEDVRYDATMALGNLGDLRAVPALVKRLQEGMTVLASAASMALVKLGRGALPQLAVTAGHSNPEVREITATVIGGIGQVEGLRLLRDLSRDPDERVRQAVADALEAFASEYEVADILDRLLEDANEDVRKAAGSTMSYLRRKRRKTPRQARGV